jgi:hypothetical protein
MIHALWGQRWTRLPFASRRKYCRNVGITLGHHRAPGQPDRGAEGAARRGSTIGMTAPFSAQEVRGLQAKMPGIRYPRPFGGSNGLVCVLLTHHCNT